MRTLNIKPISGYINKDCAFCGKPFYAKSDKAKYCSDSHKVQFSQLVKKSHQWYDIDPNEGKTILPGTVTSWVMPEEKLAFTGVSLRSSAYFSFCGGWIIFSQNNNL